MRLIDADALKRNILCWKNCYNGYSDAYDKSMIIDEIEEMPTVDAEPIIRCKDCKYWNKHHFVDIYVCSIHNKEGQYPYLLFEMSADDFCSRGERKDERD